MGDGSGTFIRIEEQTILKSGTVICVGESHIIVGLIFDSMGENAETRKMSSINSPYYSEIVNSNKKGESGVTTSCLTHLMLKFIRGPRTSETIKFMAEEAPILIGRNYDCHI